MTVITLVLRSHDRLLDVKGSFLQGEFEKNEKYMCMNIPQGLEDSYSDNVHLKLLAPTYGLKKHPWCSIGSSLRS